MTRFYANENFPFPVAEELRRLGHDVLTTQQAGRAGQAIPDAEVLQFAASANRALLTLNRKHFVRLHEQVTEHAGIVVCSVDPDHFGHAARIHAAVLSAGSLVGRLIRINRPNA